MESDKPEDTEATITLPLRDWLCLLHHVGAYANADRYVESKKAYGVYFARAFARLKSLVRKAAHNG